MNKKTIETELRKIKAELAAVLEEDCSDPGFHEFIKFKAVLLKTRIYNLKEKLRLEFEADNEFKMAFQKLYHSLTHIGASMKYKMPLNPTPEQLRHQVKLIKSVKSDIEGL
ncbi:MAG: hypothetical protein HZB33_05015 [Nitrospirae bacterium]|nr:hypothetical protein [Nitrospirota bacterium]